MKFLLTSLAALVLLLCPVSEAQGQSAKYGAAFLAEGVGARALGMGGAYVAIAEDVTSGYWNAAGLSRMAYPEIAYMHVERFGGAVTFDYGGIAWPITAQSTVGITFVRSGVNDIKNTLNAWDPRRDRPKSNPENYITAFSAADYAFYLTYARELSEHLSLGVSGKLIQRGIGDFAEAWGYSFDIAAQYRTGRFLFGVNLQDATQMYQTWSINAGAFDVTVDPETGETVTFEEAFDQTLPQGGTYTVRPVARLGSGVVFPLGLASEVTLGADVDVRFDGREAYVMNLGPTSLHPRAGVEYSYRGIVALRAGLGHVQLIEDEGLRFTPTVGAGFHLGRLAIDYGFGNFAGSARDLGYTHRISVQLSLNRSAWARPSGHE